MSKISNAIKFKEILSYDKYQKLEELAFKLEVSKRTIRTYKNDLEMAGIYIESKTGRYGGYKLYRKDSKLID